MQHWAACVARLVVRVVLLFDGWYRDEKTVLMLNRDWDLARKSKNALSCTLMHLTVLHFDALWCTLLDFFDRSAIMVGSATLRLNMGGSRKWYPLFVVSEKLTAPMQHFPFNSFCLHFQDFYVIPSSPQEICTSIYKKNHQFILKMKKVRATWNRNLIIFLDFHTIFIENFRKFWDGNISKILMPKIFISYNLQWKFSKFSEIFRSQKISNADFKLL